MRLNITHPLPVDTFKSLAGVQKPNSVSLYLPMFKKGKEQNQEMGPATLKTQINELEKILSLNGLKNQMIADYLAPIKALVADRELWRNPSDGLAIFLNEQSGLQYYQLPISFEKTTYVGDHFYLLPLFQLYQVNGQYCILELSQDHVKLYQADRYGLQDLFIEMHAPEQLEEAVGYDYKQKSLQFRTGQAGFAQGAFHGHGEGKDDEKKELIKFFKEIDKAVTKTLDGNKAPLLIAGVSRWHSLYEEVNTYSKLYKEPLVGDPEFKNKGMLHKESWKLIRPYFEETLRNKTAGFKDQEHLEITSHQISDILPAAENGRVDTLFIKKGADLFGTYGPKKCLILDSEKTTKNKSLVNKAALDTFQKGGYVYVLEQEDMPFSRRAVNALFRY